MATYSNKVAIAVCDRCNFKFKNSELRADGNSPGLRVCEDCWDPKDPWRLPPIRPDAISLKYPRPDTPLWPFANQEPDAPIVPALIWDEPGLHWDEPGAIWDEV